MSMRTIFAVVSIGLLLGGLRHAWGEQTPTLEIGAQFGAMHITEGRTDITSLVLPGGIATVSLPNLYLTWFPTSKIGYGPEFNIARSTSSANGFSRTLSMAYLGGKAAYFARQVSANSAYGLLQVAIVLTDIGDSSDSDGSAGFGLGYQWCIGDVLKVKSEGRYRRWFDDEVNEFSLVIGFGGQLSK